MPIINNEVLIQKIEEEVKTQDVQQDGSNPALVQAITVELLASKLQGALAQVTTKDLAPKALGDDALPDFHSVADILNWIREFFASIANFNIQKMDIEMIFKTFAAIDKLVSDPHSFLSPEDRESIKKLLGANNIFGDGKSLGEFLVIIAAAMAFKKNGSIDDVKAELEKLQGYFKDSSLSSLGMIKQMLETINKYHDDPNSFLFQLKTMGLIDGNNKIEINFDDHLYGAFFAFLVHSNYQQEMKKVANEEMMNYFYNHFSYIGPDGKRHWTNPDLVFMLMVTALMSPNIDILQTGVSGMSNTDDLLSKISQEISKLISQAIAEGKNWNDKDAKSFIDDLLSKLDQMGAYKDSLFQGGAFDNFKTALSSILENADVKKAISDYQADPTKIGEVTAALTKLVGTDPSAIRDALSSSASVLSNQSSSLKGRMDQITSDIKTETGALNNILQNMQKFMEFITNSMSKTA